MIKRICILGFLTVIPATTCGCTLQRETQQQMQYESSQALTSLRGENFPAAVEHYQRAVELAQKLSDQPLLLPETLVDLGQAYLSLGAAQDSSTAPDERSQAPTSYEHALQCFEAARRQFESCMKAPPSSAMAPRSGMALFAAANMGECHALQGQANALQRMRRLKEAKNLYERACAMATQHGLPDDWRRIMLEYVDLLKFMGKSAEASAAAQQLANLSAAPQLPDGAEQWKYFVHETVKKGWEYEKKNDLEQALQAYIRGYYAALGCNDHKNAAGFVTRMGMIHLKQADYRSAAREFDMALASASRQEIGAEATLTALRGKIVALMQLGRFAEAEPPAVQAVQLCEASDSKVNSGKRRSWIDLANVYAGEGKKEQALAYMLKAYKATNTEFAACSPESVVGVCDLCDLYCRFSMHQDSQQLMHAYLSKAHLQPAAAQENAARLFAQRAQLSRDAGRQQAADLFAGCARSLSSQKQH